MPMHERAHSAGQQAGLSTIQVICLRWMSEGRTLTEVAMIEGTSGSTVALHLKDACHRLGVSSLADAIAAASRDRLLQNKQPTENSEMCE